MTEETSVAIIGAGITGLALGHELRRHGIPHLILEAEDRVGGVIRSDVIDGHLLERGPQRTRLTAAMRALVRDVGLEDDVVTAPAGLPLFVYRQGGLRLVPYNPADFLRSDIVPLAAKLRLLMEPLIAPARADETVAGYFTRKVGRDLYEALLGPLYGGLYASDPADMIVGLSLGHVLRELGIRRSLLLPLLRRRGRIDPPAACTFSQGLEMLPRALHALNAESVRLQTPATAISRQGEGWMVQAGERSIRAEQVVLTTPARRTARLLRGVNEDLARSIGSLAYNPLAVVYLYAPYADLRGLGFQVAFGEKLVTRGVTFNASLFDRYGVYTAYLGGAKAPVVAKWSDDEVAAVARREFQAVTGATAETIDVSREWMPAWDRSWSATAKLAPPKGLHFAANWHSRPGIPGRLAQAARLADSLTTLVQR